MGFTMYKSGFMHFWEFYHNPTNIFIPSSGSVCWGAVKVLSLKTTLFLPSWERDVFENLWGATLIKSSIRLPTSFLLLPVFFLFVCFHRYNSVVIYYNSFTIGNSYQFYQVEYKVYLTRNSECFSGKIFKSFRMTVTSYQVESWDSQYIRSANQPDLHMLN